MPSITFSGRRVRRAVAAAALALALPWSAAAATLEADAAAWCGTSDDRLIESLARHRQQLERRQQRFDKALAAGELPPVVRAEARIEGNVVVVEDDGSIIRERNIADVARLAFRFTFKRKKTGYKLKRVGTAVNAAFGQKLALGDDDTVEVDLPFRARVYGGRYDSVWVNSDGNVTFGEGDNLSTARDIGRFLNGPARIAPLFNDLDPSAATGDGGVYVNTLGSSVRVTWFQVPEFGTNNLNTFQVTVFKTGKVVFAFGALDAQTGVVGISPGGGAGLNAIDYTEDLPTPLHTFAIAESFSLSQSIDEAVLAKTVLDAIEDVYSHLVVFTDFPVLIEPFGVVAFHMNLRNQIRGIGRPIFDASRFFGSSGALESYIMMGELGKYPNNLQQVEFNDLSSLGVLIHEQGHRWLAFPRFRKGGQPPSDELLGRQLAHWSYLFDSDDSYMEGNDIRDNGDGTFTTVPGEATFSALDRYLMGLIGPDEVPDLFFVADAGRRDRAPAAEENTFPGRRVDVTIQDVVRATGKRRPSAEEAPREIRVAYVLLVREGETPPQSSLDKVDRFRRLGAAEFERETGNRMKVRSTIEAKTAGVPR